MTPLRSPPIWCAPSNVLDPRPQRVAASMEARSRYGQPAAPYGPGWCRGKRYRSVHLAMLDVETSRWAGVVEEHFHEANQSEFVAPQPNGPTPLDLVQIGAIYDMQAKAFPLGPRAGHGRAVQSSNRSAFIFHDPDNSRDGPHISDYVPTQSNDYAGHIADSWNNGNNVDSEDLQNNMFLYFDDNSDERVPPPASHRLSAEDSLRANDPRASPARLSIPTVRDEFPNFFYAHNPNLYSKYKGDCSKGYANFSGFIRHSLEKHKRHGNIERENITPEKFDRAKSVIPPASVPKQEKNQRRYLLVREILFGTSQEIPIPFCDHGDLDGIEKWRPGKRKRSTSHSNSSIAEASGSNEMPNPDLNISSGRPMDIPALRVSAPSQTPERPVRDDDHIEDAKLGRLAQSESNFVRYHEWLEQTMRQISDCLNSMARTVPSGLQAAENLDRSTRLHHSLQKHISWANESCSKLSDFKYSEEFPDSIDLDGVPSSISFANTQSTSSGPPVTPSVFTPEDALSPGFQGQ